MIEKITIALVIQLSLCTATWNDDDGTWSEHPWDLHPYLEERYYKTLELFEGVLDDRRDTPSRRRYKRSGAPNEEWDITVDSIHSEILCRSSKTPVKTLKVLNETQILLEDNIFRLHEHDDGALFYEFGHVIDVLDPVLLVETTEFNETTMILMGYKTYAQLYIMPHTANRNWSMSKLWQTFSSETNRPTAAKFLHYDGRLYLIVVYRHNTLDTATKSSIYLWTGTHLDEIHTVMTRGGNDLATIRLKDRFLLIVSQSSSAQKVKSAVFEFVPGKGVYRTDEIDSDGPFKVLYYEDDGERYVLVVNLRGPSTIHRVTEDGALVASKKTYELYDVTAAKVIVVRRRTLVLVGNADTLSFYKPESDGLTLLYKYTFPLCRRIFDIVYLKPQNGSHTLLILARYTKSSIAIVMPFSFDINYLVSDQAPHNPFDCLNDIEYLLDDGEDTIDELISNVEKIAAMDGTLIDGVLNVTEDITLVNSKIGTININPDEELSANTKVLRETAAAVDEAIDRLMEDAAHVIAADGPVEFRDTLVVNGDLVVEKLTAEYLSLDSLNGKSLKGDLSYNGGYIPGKWFKGRKTISANNLTTSLFNSYLSAASVIDSLTAGNIHLVNKKTINDIDIDDIVLKGHESVIMGTKTFEKLSTHQIETERLGKDLLTPWIERALKGGTPIDHLHVGGNVTVSQLFAKRINNIDVDQLIDSVFQKGVHRNIDGDLKFTSSVSIKELNAKLIDDIEVNNLMTKTTEQIVNSTLRIKNLLSTRIDAETVNDVDLTKDVALISKDNTIRSPTSILNLDVSRDLHLNCGENETLCNIIPTRADELLQIYNGPVVIVGSLSVPDLSFTREAKMNVDGQPFHTDVESQFWVRDKSQTVSANVTFNKGVSAPQVTTATVNSRPADDIYSTVGDDRSVNLLMKNVEVRGNVIVPRETDCGIVRQISDTAVRSNGATYRISGKKTFAGTLRVENLKAERVNDVYMKDVILKYNEEKANNFTGGVEMKTLRIKGDMIMNADMEAKYVNGIDVCDFFERSLKVNRPAKLNRVVFENGLSVGNLEVHHGSLSKISQKIRDSLSDIHVYVKGDARISRMDGVKSVNDIPIDDYLSKVIDKTLPGQEVYGKKYFASDVVVDKEFWSPLVNGLPLERLFTDAMTVSKNEEITGRHSMENIQTGGMAVDRLNDVDMSLVIDVSHDDDVQLDGDVTFDGLTIAKDLVTKEFVTPCDFEEAAEMWTNPPMTNYKQVSVGGNVYWRGNDGFVSKVIRDTIRSDEDLVIDNEVAFDGAVSASVIRSDRYINDIDIHSIIDDSLRKNAPYPQVIKGRKTIANDLRVGRLTADRILAETINGVDVAELNRNLVRRHGEDYITGEVLVTAEVHVENLAIEGTIHGVSTEELVTIGDDRTVEGETRMDSLAVRNDMYAERVNDVNLNDFLKSTVKLDGPEQDVYGDVTFETIAIDTCRVNTLNDAPFEDIVIDSSERERIVIYGENKFALDVTATAPMTLDIFNDRNVTAMFSSALYADRDAVIRGDVTFKAPITLTGNVRPRSTVNDIDLRGSMDQGMRIIEDSKRESDLLVEKVNGNMRKLYAYVQGLSVKLLYAEIIADVDLILKDFRKTAYVTSSDEAILNVHGFQPGDVCGLPSFCLCPMNYAIRVNKDGSSFVTWNEMIPLRSYQLLTPEGVRVEIVTTSVAVSKPCSYGPRASTWIAWSTKDDIRPQVTTDITPTVAGFVSDVRSFVVDGIYYAVVCQFYDSGYDTYQTNAVMFRIDIDQKSATPIQYIPTYGAWSLDMLQTPRGTYLAVANSYDARQRKEVPSQILRFDPIGMQFQTLQWINTIGCRYAVSAVLKEVSFIFFTQTDGNPLLVFKQDDRFDTFDFYQALHFDAELKSIDVAYVSNANVRRPHLLATTSDRRLFVYEHTPTEGWIVHSSGDFDGIQGTIPFTLDGVESFFVAVSPTKSKLVSLVAQGVF